MRFFSFFIPGIEASFRFMEFELLLDKSIALF